MPESTTGNTNLVLFERGYGASGELSGQGQAQGVAAALSYGVARPFGLRPLCRLCFLFEAPDAHRFARVVMARGHGAARQQTDAAGWIKAQAKVLFRGPARVSDAVRKALAVQVAALGHVVQCVDRPAGFRVK